VLNLVFVSTYLGYSIFVDTFVPASGDPGLAAHLGTF